MGGGEGEGEQIRTKKDDKLSTNGRLMLTNVPGILILQLLTHSNQRVFRLDCRQLCSAPDPDSLNTAIRDHDHPNSRNPAVRQVTCNLEEILAMGEEGLLVEEHDGFIGSDLESGDRHGLGGVALVVGSVDFDRGHMSGATKFDDCEIDVARGARATGLPAVRHIVSSPREEHVGGVAVMGVRELCHRRTGGDGGKVVHLMLVLRVDSLQLSIDPESRNPTIGVHTKPDMRKGILAWLVKLVPMTNIRLQRRLLQKRDPLNPRPLLMRTRLGLTSIRCILKPLNRDKGGMVTGQEGSIDFKALNGSGVSELDDTPVVMGVMTTGLPTVEPSPRGDEVVRAGDGCVGGEEVLGLGEPFVGDGEDLASALGNSQV